MFYRSFPVLVTTPRKSRFNNACDGLTIYDVEASGERGLRPRRGWCEISADEQY
jgi:hypothetical protein